MKRGIKILIVVLALAVGISLTACSPGTFPSDGGAAGYSTDFEGFSGNVTTSDTYGERYAVKSVDLKIASEGEAFELTRVSEAVDKAYGSYVTIEAGVEDGLQLGSGTIVDIDVEYENAEANRKDFVYIFTCHHVIDGSNRIAVYIPKCVNEASDEYEYYEYGFAATLMGSDKKSDIAVLRIEIAGYDDLAAADVTKAQICGDSLQIGDWNFLLGNPSGDHPGSFSLGNVSSIFREVSVENIGSMKLIQTTAEANPGNSGGGVFNLAGQFIGILNSGLKTSSKGEPLDGLSFFIPVNDPTGVAKNEQNGIRSISYALISTVTDDYNGYVEGRWMLGATLQSVRAGGGLFGGGQEYIQVSAIATDNDTYSLSTCGIANGDYLFGMSYKYNGETYTFDEGTLSEFSSFFEEMQQRLTVGDTVQVTYGKDLRGAEETGTMTVKQYIYSVA